MLIKARGVNRVDHRHEGAPVPVEKLDGLFLEFAVAQFVHEARFIDGFLPALVALRSKLGNEFFGLRFIQFEHGSTSFTEDAWRRGGIYFYASYLRTRSVSS